MSHFQERLKENLRKLVCLWAVCVWVRLCFISKWLITHLWLRINLTKALAMMPTSALGAKWKYSWATAITTYRDRERGSLGDGYREMNTIFLFRGRVWTGPIVIMLANQLQHFVNVNNGGMCERGFKIFFKTNLIIIKTDTKLKYIFIIKQFKIVITKTIQIIGKKLN